MIGCACATCRSDDPRDQRYRPSVFIELDDGLRVLVDTSTDLRAQALRFGITRLDAILYTHSHADHILGLDDVRRFNVLQGEAISCYGDDQTLADIRRTFQYVFDTPTPRGGGVPRLRLFPVAGPFCLGRQLVVPVPIEHGARRILGYRFGPFAYLTDCSGIPDASWPLVEGVDTLVLDALRDRPHPTHFTLEQAVEVARRIGARATWLTHMCHDLPHAATCARLPAGIELAYDGLAFEI
jgi:phosphoribosyl 1,2-cyclic phosphate phosphodiesterase